MCPKYKNERKKGRRKEKRKQDSKEKDLMPKLRNTAISLELFRASIIEEFLKLALSYGGCRETICKHVNQRNQRGHF